MTLNLVLRRSALALCLLVHPALAQTGPAFEGSYSAGVGRHQSRVVIQRLSDLEYRLTVTVADPSGCAGRVEARAVLSGGVLTTTRGRVPGPGAESADICTLRVARTPDGIRIAEETCSSFHGARCGFDGAYRATGDGRVASAPSERRWSEFYCKTPDTIEPEFSSDPNYRVRLPSANVRPELGYEIFRHGNRFAFPAPDGDPSEVMTITGVKFASKDDTLTVTGPGGQRWFVKPLGAAIVQVSGHGLKRPITGRGCVWR